MHYPVLSLHKQVLKIISLREADNIEGTRRFSGS